MIKFYILLISFSICICFISLQYRTRTSKHERLEKYGLKAKVDARKFESTFGVDYISYYFITLKGQRIDGIQKCGDKFYCLQQYSNSTVVYNTQNPAEYEFSFDFDEYSLNMTKVFYFIICLPFATLITYSFITTFYFIVGSFYGFLKRDGFINKK